ncbi:hypothetical protein [Geobacillus sp. TFV-3]|uniref:hypothetical protein n=1 Tax=Geobacillus sp. TFV-3 TaxID=1897059 RepID=UPI001356D00B|nr:hypothetical protein [Geobacillus sp. TFV-3]KAF0993626.1 hypothetical protein BJQ97_00234 [Geobacillus sp. TFV-3]
MLINQYFKIYSKLVEGHVNKLLSWGTAFLFGGMLAVMLYMFEDDIVLKGVPAVIFLLHLVAIFMNENQRESINLLFAFLKTTPIPSFTIIVFNFLCKLFSKDQIRFYFCSLFVLIAFKIPLSLIGLYFFRIFFLIMISQVIEYMVCVVKEKYFSRFLVPLLLLFILFLLGKKEPYFFSINLLLKNLIKLYDDIILLGFIILLVISPFFVNKLLNTKKTSIPTPIIKLSNIIAGVSSLVLFNKQLKNIIKTYIKIYIRDKFVLFKYLVITTLSIIYSWISYTFQGSEDKISSFYLTLMMNFYFFYEIRMLGLLYSNDLDDFFPILNRYKTISIDFIAGFLNILFSLLALAFYSILLKVDLSIMLTNLTISCVFYIISVYFKVRKSATKKGIIITSIKYIVLCLFIGLMLLELGIFFNILVLIILCIFTYYKIYREERTENTL